MASPTVEAPVALRFGGDISVSRRQTRRGITQVIAEVVGARAGQGCKGGQRRVGSCFLALDVKVILTPPCLFH
jgi:hypothetical protein